MLELHIKGISFSMNIIFCHLLGTGFHFEQNESIAERLSVCSLRLYLAGSGRYPGEGNGNLTLVLLPGEFQGQRSLAGYRPWDHKESDMTVQLTFTFKKGQEPWLATLLIH